MALTFTFAHLKGGVGKSTLALNLGVCLHSAGHQSIIIDADPQGTCRQWSEVAAEQGHMGPTVVGVSGSALRRELPNLSKGFDVVIIDAPPRLGRETRGAMMASDAVIIPITPGPADVWALKATLELLDEAREFRPDLLAVAVMNKAQRTTLANLTSRAVRSAGVTVLGATVSNRVAFGEAIAAGQGVVRYAPESSAAREVQRFAADLFEVMEDEDGQRAAAS